MDVARIGIAGDPGTGTTTTALYLAQVLGLPFFCAGWSNRFFRRKLGFETQTDFELYLQENTEVDRNLDCALKRFCEVNENCIVEARLAALALPRDPKHRLVLMVCHDFNECCSRIHQRDGGNPSVIRKETIARLNAFERRSQSLYSFDHNDPSHYDLVIDTTFLDEGGVRAKVDEYFEITQSKKS